MRKLLLFLSFALLISYASALSCNYPSINNSISSLSCNSDLMVTASSFGQGFTISPLLPLTFTNSSKSFTISISQTAPYGSLGALVLTTNNETLTVPIFNTNSYSGCQLNPSLVAYTQSIQQGTTFSLPKIVFNPTNCQGNLALTSSSVNIQGGIITSSGQKPITTNTITQDGVIITIDTTGLSPQTYSSYLNINALGTSVQIPFLITVTSGTNPSTNFDCTDIPVCSVTSTQLNLNSTYSMVCTNILPNIKIIPSVDSSMLVGTGRVDTSANQYVWYFTPIKLGNTIIKANFNYLDAPACNPYSQEVRITSSGGSISGTTLKFLFTPDLSQAQPNQNVIVQLVDSKTLSLVDSPSIYVDALPLVANGSTYYFKFGSDTNYTFRGRSNGYDDLIQYFSISNRPINISINPSSGDSSTMFSINVESGALLFMDGTKINSNYTGTIPQGNHTFKAIKDGYTDTSINLTVEESPYATLTTAFEKGVNQLISLNKPLNWTVMYQDSIVSIKNALSSGFGTTIQFTPTKTGIYTIDSSGKTIWSNEIKGWDGKIFGFNWLLWIIGIIGIVVLVMIIKNRRPSSEGLFAGNTNIGGR